MTWLLQSQVVFELEKSTDEVLLFVQPVEDYHTSVKPRGNVYKLKSYMVHVEQVASNGPLLFRVNLIFDLVLI